MTKVLFALVAIAILILSLLLVRQRLAWTGGELVEVDLTGTSGADGELARASVNQQLGWLLLEGSDVTDSGLLAIDTSKVQTVRCLKTPVTAYAFERGMWNELRYIEFGPRTLPCQFWVSMEAASKIEGIIIRGSDIQRCHNDLPMISANAIGLIECCIDDHVISSLSRSALACLTMDLSRSQLGLFDINNAWGIRHMDVSGTNVSTEAIAEILSLKSLESLAARECGSVDWSRVAQLQPPSSLRKLDLSNNVIPKDAEAGFASASWRAVLVIR